MMKRDKKDARSHRRESELADTLVDLPGAEHLAKGDLCTEVGGYAGHHIIHEIGKKVNRIAEDVGPGLVDS